MKLVISTQIRENYGAHDWDGEGECPQYWKCKGGEVYVVRDLTQRNIERVLAEGIPTLSALIEERNNSFEEYVIDYRIMGDNEPEGEPWETPTEFYWGGDRWLARKVVDNTTEYGYMNREIATKVEGWIPLEGGERADYTAEYFDGSGNELVKYRVPAAA